MSELTPSIAENMVKESLFGGYTALKMAGSDTKSILDSRKDIVTNGDIVVGDAIVDQIKKYGVGFSIYSEEKGKTSIGDNPKYSIIFDDIDGTANFNKGDDMLPYGSIMGVFDREDPSFNDCLSAGFLEFNSGNLYMANRGRGAYKIPGFAGKLDNGQNVEWGKTEMRTSGKTGIMDGLKVLNDQYMLGDINGAISDSLLKKGRNNWLNDYGSKAVHIAQISYGAQDLFVSANNCNRTDKLFTGEEIGPGYLIVKEAGGATMDFNCNDIGNETIGLGDKKTYDIVMAATEELGKNFLWRLAENEPTIKKYIQSRSRKPS
ncbi:MAG: hypothetical protein HY833_00190 [Candidatus Aenigmarchaeota archaeon]|nr:hypothetical protein [Candidatus Aenigmarchaeota archaeon]